MKRQTLYEALILIATAIVIGVVYTLLTKQGFFAEQKPKDKEAPALEIISLERAKALSATDSALFIDSRHEFDYKMGHIPGSVNVALSEFDVHRKRLEGIPKTKLLVVYCDGTQCNSSLELATKLIEIGFTNVQVFFDGWQEWKGNGLPIEKS